MSSLSPVPTASQHVVAIVGGGPVGISTALELARHGIEAVVLEQREHGQCHPARTNLTNLRSMEHLRRWGIADSLRANDPVGDEFVRSITYVTALNGHVVTDLHKIFAFEDQLPIASDRPEFAPNAGIEKTFQNAAAAHPHVDIRFGSTVTGFTQDDAGVHVTYTDTDGEHVIDAAYLVAADGSRSPIRHELGIRMKGIPDLVAASIWHVHAPGLKERMDVGRSSFFFFINEYRDNMMLIAQDSDDHYMFGALPVADGVDADNWDAAKDLLFRNVGFEFDVTPISGGLVRIHSLITPQFRDRRVFLAGDAAHLISPMGGWGMNLGISDAADLGWKLAATLQGWGGEQLLDSYHVERTAMITPILEACIGNTNRNAESFTVDGITSDGPDGVRVREEVGTAIATTKTEEFNSIGAQLGSNYHRSPIVVGDGTEPAPFSQGTYVPTAVPGSLSPHVWIDGATSLYDLFGTGFTLLITGDDHHDHDADRIRTVAQERGIPLTIIKPDHPDLRALYQADLVLIRPDQHVAWRGDTLPEQLNDLFDVVCGIQIHASVPL